MRITWDEPKRLANLRKHGVELADVERFGWGEATVFPTRADRYGRPRELAIGPLDDRLYVVIFARLGSEAISVISLRRASIRERRLYHAHRSP